MEQPLLKWTLFLSQTGSTALAAIEERQTTCNQRRNSYWVSNSRIYMFNRTNIKVIIRSISKYKHHHSRASTKQVTDFHQWHRIHLFLLSLGSLFQEDEQAVRINTLRSVKLHRWRALSPIFTLRKWLCFLQLPPPWVLIKRHTMVEAIHSIGL